MTIAIIVITYYYYTTKLPCMLLDRRLSYTLLYTTVTKHPYRKIMMLITIINCDVNYYYYHYPLTFSLVTELP